MEIPKLKDPSGMFSGNFNLVPASGPPKATPLPAARESIKNASTAAQIELAIALPMLKLVTRELGRFSAASVMYPASLAIGRVSW